MTRAATSVMPSAALRGGRAASLGAALLLALSLLLLL
jgi:hypothetical protein